MLVTFLKCLNDSGQYLKFINYYKNKLFGTNI